MSGSSTEVVSERKEKDTHEEMDDEDEFDEEKHRLSFNPPMPEDEFLFELSRADLPSNQVEVLESALKKLYEVQLVVSTFINSFICSRHYPFFSVALHSFIP